MGSLVPPVPGGTGQTLAKAMPDTEVLACVWSEGQGAGAACTLPTRLGRLQPTCADKPRAASGPWPPCYSQTLNWSLGQNGLAWGLAPDVSSGCIWL